MTRKLFLTALILATPLASFAGNYPELNDYRAVATDMLRLAKTASTTAEVQTLLEGQRKLVTSGGEILKLYASKNPVCKAQFDVYLSEISISEAKTVRELHERYHDAKGLPMAPKHCYLGRSLVVHPSMNVRRILEGWSETVRADVMDETKEVIEHLVKVERNLDNPPH